MIMLLAAMTMAKPTSAPFRESRLAVLFWPRCPASRCVLAQGSQEDGVHGRPLGQGPGPGGPLKVARDTAQQVDARGRQPSQRADRRRRTLLQGRKWPETHRLVATQ